METFLLDKRYVLILKMIHELSKIPTKALSIIELHEKLGISRPTIKAYFQILQSYCQDRGLATFTLEKEKIKMNQDTHFNNFDLYNYFMQDSVKYQIMMSIFKNPEISFTKLHLDLNISKSSCSEHISQINQFLVGYHCNLNFSGSDPIAGTNHQVRFLFYNLFWGIDQDALIGASPSLEAVTQFLLENTPTMTYMTFSKIRLGFYIFQIASRYGLFIEPEVDFRVQDSPFVSYDDFFKKLNELNFLKDCPDLATKETESRYLYFLYCRQYILTLDDCKRFSDKIAIPSDPNVHYLVAEFQDYFQIKLRDSEVRCLSVNLSLFFKEASLFYGRAKDFDLEELVNIFNDTREPTQAIEKFLDGIYERNDIMKTRIQNFPSLHPYCIMILKIMLIKHQEPIKLLVQSSISTLHREALISQIESITPFPIKVYNYNDLKDEIPDGIISNWLPEKKFKDVPFFSTSLFFTEWNEADLEYFLNRLVAEKMIG